MPLLIATGNAGKLAEFRRLLPDIEIISPSEIGLSSFDVEESGTTFRENALLKAQAFADASGCIAVADDSGLEVDALGGAPGVHSARFGGPDLDDAGRCRLLLQQLESVSPSRRSARFRCHLMACPPDGDPLVEGQGSCEGLITTTPAGTGGFGYDPVFWVNELDRTMAQISSTQKNQISHRGQAIEALRQPLLATFPELAKAS